MSPWKLLAVLYMLVRQSLFTRESALGSVCVYVLGRVLVFAGMCVRVCERGRSVFFLSFN